MSARMITVAVVESGHRIGQAHLRAKLSDDDIELIRDIYDEGMVGYGTLAKAFNVPKWYIRDIVTFRRRAASPAAFKTVPEDPRRPVPVSRLKQLGIDTAPPELDEDWDNSH